MTLHKSGQPRMKLDGAHKSDVRTQFAALCYRIHNGKVEFCLITSRNAGRWIIPKGWPMHGTTPAKAAATEALEEAGLEGKVHAQTLGVFTYEKEITDGAAPCLAIVYALRVKTVLSDWPERKQRRRKWFSRKKAAARISNLELRQMILKFDPTQL